MNEQQFEIIANLLDMTDAQRIAAHQHLFQGAATNVELQTLINRMQHADSLIRSAYILHGPMEFRIMVSHHDLHRTPGSLKLQVGDMVRLTAQSTERWIPVRVTALPSTPTAYYRGVITQQLVSKSRFQVGNAVSFSEDQVMIEPPRVSTRRPSRTASQAR